MFTSMARVRRSVLFVPGSDRAALRGALKSGPDTLVVDLEDTVTPACKHAARALAVAFLGEPAPAGTERAARVNSPATPYFSDDLPAVIGAGADALVIPKVNSAGEIRAVDDQVARTEVERGRPPGSVRLLPLIETALGVLNAYAIATACPRVDALVLGHVDLSLSLGIREAGLRQGTILHARCQVVLAARAAGRDAIDALFMNPTDADGFREEAARASASASPASSSCIRTRFGSSTRSTRLRTGRSPTPGASCRPSTRPPPPAPACSCSTGG